MIIDPNIQSYIASLDTEADPVLSAMEAAISRSASVEDSTVRSSAG